MFINDTKEKTFSYLIFGLASIFLIILYFFTEGNYGGTDNFNHYFIALTAWQEPHYFLDAWGRPLYTILSAPFALLGYEAVKLFNVALGILTAWFAFLIAKRTHLRPSWMVILFVAFTPVYLITLYTALTEILFSFVLVLAIYLFFRSSYVASAIVISFLPFARTEGYFLIPILGLALLMKRQWRALPFLAFGFLFFCFIGSFYYHDFFWPITKFPYPVGHGHEIYKEHGSLWHFLVTRDFIIGLPLELLFLAGVIQLGRELFAKTLPARKEAVFFMVLLLFPFLTYLAFHSILWWKAMGGSMGLVRVMAAVMPLAALVAMKGYAAIDVVFGKLSWLRILFALLVIYFLVRAPFAIYHLPLKSDPEEATIKEAAKWLRNSPWKDRPFYYTCLDFPFFYGANSYDPENCRCAWFFFTKNLPTLPTGAVLIWDAHFGPNENQVPLDSVLLNPELKLINVFRPPVEWISYGGYNYEVYLVEKMVAGSHIDNGVILDSLNKVEAAKFRLVKRVTLDFESDHPGVDMSKVTAERTNSGSRSLKIDSNCEFSQGIFYKASDLTTKREGVQFWCSMQVYSDTAFIHNPTSLVISVEDKNGSYHYRSVALETLSLVPGQWQTVGLTARIPEIRSGSDMVKVYLWHTGRFPLYLDDLVLEVRVIQD